MFVVSAEALRRAREARGWSVAVLAQRAGVAERTVTRLESADAKALPVTIESLADAVGVAKEALVRAPASTRRARRARGAAERTPPAPEPAAPTFSRFTLPPRSELDTLALLEKEAGLDERPLVDGAPRLLASSLQDVNTANRGHRGRRFWITGVVDRQRGLTADEARLLASRRGEGGRFLVLHDSAKGRTIAVVVHAPLVADVVALQKQMGERVKLLIEVTGAADGDSGGFSTFWSDAVREWTFVLVRRLPVGARAGGGGASKRR